MAIKEWDKVQNREGHTGMVCEVEQVGSFTYALVSWYDGPSERSGKTAEDVRDLTVIGRVGCAS